MSSGGIIAIFVVGVLVVIAFAVYNYKRNKARQQAFAAWASAHRWGYATRDDRYDDMPWGAPFGVGSGRAAFDVLIGTWHERPAVCFTYRYQTTSSNGKTTTTTDHWFALHSLRLPKALPGLRVSREGVLSSVARAVGFHDIEFESEDFNRTFKVKGDDRKFASDVIHPQLMARLLDTNAPGFLIAGADIVLSAKGRLEPTGIEPGFAYLESIVASIPDFVWDVH